MSRRGFGDIRRFPTIESTNSYLLGEARRGAAQGVVAVADHQSAGRGRLGRRWEAPPRACLLMSVLLRPPLDPGDLHLCTGAVALAAAEACEATSGVRPQLKWPNDLVVGGRKLAGVLAEVLADLAPSTGAAPATGAAGWGGSCPAVVVGVGCNLEWPGPPGAGGTSLHHEGGRPVARDVLLDALLDALEPRYEGLDAPAGRSAVAAEMKSRCDTLGRQVRVDLVADRGTVTGTAVDLTDSGHLVVETAAGRCEVVAGDVEHLRAPGGPPGAN